MVHESENWQQLKTATHKNPFYGPLDLVRDYPRLSGSRTNLDFTEAKDI